MSDWKRNQEAILNERKHGGYKKWAVAFSGLIQSPDDDEVAFTPFEAIAIAEKYQRDDLAKPST